MIKAIEIAKKISKQLDQDNLELLESVNLHNEFKPIYEMTCSLIAKNTLVCFVIYSFDNDSAWIDTKKDRIENKIKILNSLGVSFIDSFWDEIITNKNIIVNSVIAEYLIDLADWRWSTVSTLLDYHAAMIRFANNDTETERSVDKMNKEGEVRTLTQEYDIDKVAKVNLQKGDLFEKAIGARERADKLIIDIKRDFSHTDDSTSKDFNIEFTDIAKKRDIYSWRTWIKETVIPLREQQKKELQS